MKHLNQKYFTIAVYALAVVAFSLLFLVFCVNFGLITSVIASFFSAIGAILYAILFSFLLLPAVKRFDIHFEKLLCKKKKHPYLVSGLSIGLTLFLALAALAVLILGIFPHVLGDAEQLYDSVVGAKAAMDSFVAENTAAFPILGDLYRALISLFEPAGEGSILSALLSSMGGVIGSVVGQVSNIFLGLIIAIYFLASRSVISGIVGKLVAAFVPDKHIKGFVLFFKRLYTDFASFTFNRFVCALFFSASVLLLTLALRIPLLSVIVILSLIAHLIPVIGPILGNTASIILVLILKPNVWGILFGVALLSLEFFTTHILLPHMLPKKLRPSYALTALAVLVGFAMLGVIGAFLAVPLYATLSIEVRRFICHRLNKKNLPTNRDAYHTFDASVYAEFEAKNRRDEQTESKEDQETT